jgi:type IV pilus assembly protein PilC
VAFLSLHHRSQASPHSASPLKESVSALASEEKAAIAATVSSDQAKAGKKAPKSSSDFSRFLGALSHIGLGKERTRFIQNISILLTAGLSVIDALETIEVETRSKAMKKIIQAIHHDVTNGVPLWRAMDTQNLFAPYELSLIRIGEESGSLSKNMEHLSEQQEKDHALRQKVKMAMIYPSIVLTLTFVITIGLAWFVLPKLVTVLVSLGTKLPLVTRIIIAIANFFQLHGIVAVPLFLVFVFFFVLLCKYTRFKAVAQRVIFRIPGIGTLARQATIARFGVILGSLLRAGVPLVDAIKSLADVTDIVVYKRFYYALAEQIELGNSFGGSFARIKQTKKVLPISVQQLVVTGERSGSLSEMLLKIASIYEKKAEETAHKLPIILEPMLLFFIGGVVGTVAFAIIVPIYSIVGSIGH